MSTISTTEPNSSTTTTSSSVPPTRRVPSWTSKAGGFGAQKDDNIVPSSSNVSSTNQSVPSPNTRTSSSQSHRAGDDIELEQLDRERHSERKASHGEYSGPTGGGHFGGNPSRYGPSFGRGPNDRDGRSYGDRFRPSNTRDMNDSGNPNTSFSRRDTWDQGGSGYRGAGPRGFRSAPNPTVQSQSSFSNSNNSNSTPSSAHERDSSFPTNVDSDGILRVSQAAIIALYTPSLLAGHLEQNISDGIITRDSLGPTMWNLQNWNDLWNRYVICSI
jgi:hypothetical protein